MSETRLSETHLSETHLSETRRVLRFLLVGSLAAAVNWIARIALSAAFAPALSFEMAVLIAYAIGMTSGFLLYRAYVFPDAGLPMAVQLRRFIAVNLVSAVEVWLVAVVLLRMVVPALGIGLEVMPIAEALAHGIAIAIGAATSYVGHKLLTFRSAQVVEAA
ncbi:MAG: GtrA family protein [Alphaproteobacteria bacterium]|nr:GtrA family protein [Alphaproteobacteria bacterium]